MTRTTWIVLAGLAGTAIVGIALARRPAAPTAAPEARPVLAVRTVLPGTESWPDEVLADGPVAAWQEAVVATELGGARIESVLVEVGDRVAAGQVLVRLDPRSAAADLAQADAALAQAEAKAVLADADARRALDAARVLSAADQDTTVLNASAAAAAVASARAQREAARLRLERTAVTAPDAGTVSRRSAVAGAVSQAGGEVLRLIRQDRIVWRPALLPADLPRLATGAAMVVDLSGGATAAGILRRLPVEIDARTRTGEAEADLPPGTARPGLVLAGRIQAGPPRPVRTLPLEALVLRDGRHEVVVVDGEGRTRILRVHAGRIRGERIEIRDGLPADARVVAAGGGFLGDGDRVRVVDDRP